MNQAEGKRPREEEDDLDLSQLLAHDDDDFMSAELKHEKELEQKRTLRQQRLRKIALDEKEKQDQPSLMVAHSVGQSSNSNSKKYSADPTNLAAETIVALQREVDSNNRLNSLEEGSYDDDDNNDGFDMFSGSVSPVADKNTSKPSSHLVAKTERGHEQEDWDDAEGYYKAVIGELIAVNNFSAVEGQEQVSSEASVALRIAGVIGKGVFSTVLKCTTISNSSSVEIPPIVALKCIRHNDTMTKAALQELRILLRLKGSPGIVPLLLPATVAPIEYRGHVVLIFPFMEYNLRDVLQKFGKGVGLSLQAVRSYFGQLLAAASHLKKHGIIHADLKPDNILVRGDFGVVQLADFGSAFEVNSPEQTTPTPYLVSRYYRAPEIILGLAPTFAIDLWSLAVSVAEIYLGDVLFRGTSNNDMLFVFMQHMGPFSNRIIRQHLAQCQRLPIARHFQQEGATFSFTQQTTDLVTGAPVHQVRSLASSNNYNSTFPNGTPLHPKLLKAKSSKDSRTFVSHFSDLLQKCLALDPTRRMDLKDALRHEFFRQTTTGSTTVTASDQQPPDKGLVTT